MSGNSSFFTAYTMKLKQFLGKLLRSEKQFYTYLFIGFLNGFLPCGLVYVAVAGAVATGDILNSALFMAAFGFGTFPIMFMVTVLGKFISVQWRNQMRKAVPVFIGAMAVLLILRGLNLGIPYISPEMKVTPTGTESCCHKD
jgi:sulfite exporter TauE/SafE